MHVISGIQATTEFYNHLASGNQRIPANGFRNPGWEPQEYGFTLAVTEESFLGSSQKHTVLF